MTSSPTSRMHGLDAVRGFALLLGVFLHAGMSFIPSEFPMWITQDANSSPAFALTFYVPHIFRMLLFFILAGFFARLAWQKRGALGFALDRFKRVFAPLAVFWFPSLMLIVAVVIWGAIKANGGEAPEAPEDPPLTAQNFPLTHLWFLYLLSLFYVGALIIRLTVSLVDPKGKLRDMAGKFFGFAGRTPLLPLVMAIPATLAFMNADMWYSWFGIPTPDTGLYPNTVALTAYGTGFAFGWMLHRQSGLLDTFRRFWWAYMAVAIALTVVCLQIIGMAPSFAPADDSAQSWAYAAAYSLAGWSFSFGFIGLGLALFANENRARRYLADASYWVYIWHLPIVMALQVWLNDVEMLGVVKYLLVNAVTLAVTIASYHLLVRGSWIGAWLNGRRYGKKAAARSAQATQRAGASANA